MVEPKQFHLILLTWVHLLLLLFLVVPEAHHGAEAQSPIQPVPAFASHRGWDPSIAIVAGAIIFTFLFVSVFSIYLRHCADSYLTELSPVGAAADWPCSCSEGIHRDVLDTFPILFYATIKGLKIGKGVLECAVCLSEFKDHETLRLLPKCNHVFHPDCIDAWLASHVTCPVCRANLIEELGEVAIAVETQLSDDERNEESPGSIAEHGGGENEIEQYPVAPNANGGQSNSEEDPGKQNRPSKWGLLGKLPRSNSTGHSLVEPGKCLERYTLRLPEDVRKYILLNQGTIQGSASYKVVMPMVGSSRKGLCWSDSEVSSRGKRNNNVQPWQDRWV